jgi:hypothetical protein
VDGVLLDVTLALRLLARYPLLTGASALGMAFGLAAGIVGFEVRSRLTAAGPSPRRV